LTPYHSRPPHLYGLPKVHNPDIPLRPIVSSICSPCYALADFPHILSPLTGKAESFIKKSTYLIKLKSVSLQSPDIVVSFDVVSLLTNMKVDETLQVISNKLHNGYTLMERSALQPKAIMVILEACLRTTYVRWMIVLPTKNGMALGSSLSPIVSNIYMKNFENLALDSALHKSSLWLLYVDDTFVVWPHGPGQLQYFLSHLNSLRSTIQFAMEIGSV
jgi:hypothetical protein